MGVAVTPDGEKKYMLRKQTYMWRTGTITVMALSLQLTQPKTKLQTR
jgi:hypothetical protein